MILNKEKDYLRNQLNRINARIYGITKVHNQEPMDLFVLSFLKMVSYPISIGLYAISGLNIIVNKAKERHLKKL